MEKQRLRLSIGSLASYRINLGCGRCLLRLRVLRLEHHTGHVDCFGYRHLGFRLLYCGLGFLVYLELNFDLLDLRILWASKAWTCAL